MKKNENRVRDKLSDNTYVVRERNVSRREVLDSFREAGVNISCKGKIQREFDHQVRSGKINSYHIDQLEEKTHEQLKSHADSLGDQEGYLILNPNSQKDHMASFKRDKNGQFVVFDKNSIIDVSQPTDVTLVVTNTASGQSDANYNWTHDSHVGARKKNKEESSSNSSNEKIIKYENRKEALDKALSNLETKGTRKYNGNISAFENDHISGILPYEGRLSKGKIVGFETKGNNKYTKVRSDYDEKKGPHINVEVGKGGHRKKYAFQYPGEESDHKEVVDRLSKPEGKTGADVYNNMKNYSTH